MRVHIVKGVNDFLQMPAEREKTHKKQRKNSIFCNFEQLSPHSGECGLKKVCMLHFRTNSQKIHTNVKELIHETGIIYTVIF